jgi:hypothetical protein
MGVRTVETLTALYERDETAWLEVMAELARDGRAEELDLPHLAEYLGDMARRDRREVESRLVIVLAHLLNGVHQSDRRSRSWRATVIEQRQELNRLVGRGVLRNHAEDVLADLYPEAVERVVAETGLSAALLPAECPYTLDPLLAIELPEGDAGPSA